MTFTIKTDTIIVDDEDADFVLSRKWHLRIDANGTHYVQTGFRYRGEKQSVMLHHCIIGMIKGMLTDHKNGNTLDNRRENLRFATYSQNGCNRKKQNRETSSHFKGVSWCSTKRRWKSCIHVNGKKYWVGSFHNELDAAKAWNIKARELHGEFARLNPIENAVAKDG